MSGLLPGVSRHLCPKCGERWSLPGGSALVDSVCVNIIIIILSYICVLLQYHFYFHKKPDASNNVHLVSKARASRASCSAERQGRAARAVGHLIGAWHDFQSLARKLKRLIAAKKKGFLSRREPLAAIGKRKRTRPCLGAKRARAPAAIDQQAHPASRVLLKEYITIDRKNKYIHRTYI